MAEVTVNLGQDIVIVDETITQEDTDTLSFTLSENGAATDVSAWTIYYDATHEDPAETDNISVATSAVTYSDSGTGTTDTFNIPRTSAATDIAAGRYKHRVRYKIGTAIDTLVEGTLTIKTKDRTAV